MRIAIVTDAWRPQTNGVVTTLENTVRAAERLGHEVQLITAAGMKSIACPSYPEIRLALWPAAAVRDQLQHFAPEAIHIATEGPLGLAARAYCLGYGLPFTSSYHTQFPEYINQRWPIPISLGYAYMRWFHRPAVRTLVGTDTVRRQLQARYFKRIVLWSRGVDTEIFRPGDKTFFDMPRPIMLYAGRVAVEKNLDAFLRVEVPGTKIVVGGGPALDSLRSRYPHAVFLGYKYRKELARCMAGADVFVFPSATDTFGIVMLEAMACGLPVAAFPVQGPLDVVRDGVTGALDADLAAAIRRALALDAQACRSFAQTHTWERCTRQFIGHLAFGAEEAVRAWLRRRLPSALHRAGAGVAVAAVLCRARRYWHWPPR